ncbi:MAG: DUF4186 family protein [Singulisphaera sp.]
MTTPDSDLEFAPLDIEWASIKCKSTDCKNNLHCFQQDKQDSGAGSGGRCRECGAKLVDWSRVQRRDLQDSAYTFSMLRHEMIRHRFWHRPLDPRERNYARRKGRVGIRAAAEKRIRSSVGPKEPFKNGAQTPFKGHILYYAQHAVACCCRRTCIAEWHGIPQGRELTDLVCMYVAERIPELTENGEDVPPIRKPQKLEV